MLNTAAALPFQVDEHVEVGEEARLRHRYLDLRRPQPSRIMRLRSEVNRTARELLHGEGFVEVETPTLTRSTPEGARDFLVPARLAPGSWYALPQSPQLFKQLLQVGGIEKTTRSPAATATRTSARTASPSSPSWTSRPPSWSRTT